MDTRLYLKQIETVVRQMADMDLAERVKAYAAVKTLADELQDHAEERDIFDAYLAEKLASLLWSVRSIAGLSDGNGHKIDQHQVWVLGALSALGGSLCFGRTE